MARISIEERERETKGTIKVKFINNDQLGLPLDFSYMGPRDKEPRRYHLESGRVYELPKDVVKHLNSLSYPVYEMRTDSETGGMKSMVIGRQNRFVCLPVE